LQRFVLETGYLEFEFSIGFGLLLGGDCGEVMSGGVDVGVLVVVREKRLDFIHILVFVGVIVLV